MFVALLVMLVSVGFCANAQALSETPTQTCDVSSEAVIETCPTDNSQEVAATPEPTFVNATCDKSGYYTLPETEGIQYVVGKNSTPVAAGTYLVTQGELVVISAYLTGNADANDESRPATDNVWTHTFPSPSCPQVKGAHTITDDGEVLGAATTLADTGTSSQLPTIAAIGLILVSLILYRQPHHIRYRGR